MTDQRKAGALRRRGWNGIFAKILHKGFNRYTPR